MANWGTILFVVGVVPLSWLLEAKGLRKTVLLISFLIALGTTLRWDIQLGWIVFYNSLMRLALNWYGRMGEKVNDVSEVKPFLYTLIVFNFYQLFLNDIFRTLSTDDLTFTVMSHICAILNGLSGVTVMAAPPAISAAWFPPSERTTATCITLVRFNFLASSRKRTESWSAFIE